MKCKIYLKKNETDSVLSEAIIQIPDTKLVDFNMIRLKILELDRPLNEYYAAYNEYFVKI
jgi:hypothetical protein